MKPWKKPSLLHGNKLNTFSFQCQVRSHSSSSGITHHPVYCNTLTLNIFWGKMTGYNQSSQQITWNCLIFTQCHLIFPYTCWFVENFGSIPFLPLVCVCLCLSFGKSSYMGGYFFTINTFLFTQPSSLLLSFSPPSSSFFGPVAGSLSDEQNWPLHPGHGLWDHCEKADWEDKRALHQMCGHGHFWASQYG